MFDKTRFNCIPCYDKSKKPSVKWLEFEHNKNPNSVISTNYAIIMGETSDVFVIDIDSPEIFGSVFPGSELLLKSTLVVKTGSGGYHVYFKYNPNIQTKRLDNDKGQHIDIQSQGTYVLGPGSIHDETFKEYEIISSTTEIKEMRDISGFYKHLETLGFRTEGSGLKPFHEIAKGNIPEGSRNISAFKYAANLIDNVEMDVETTWKELSRWNESLSPPLGKSELRAVFESAVKKASKNVKNKPVPLTNFRLLRELSARDENKTLVFNGFITAMDEHKTVTTAATYTCSNNHDTLVLPLKGNGYENISAPRCPRCSYYMSTQPGTKKTTDLRIVLVQEPTDEIKNNNPIRKTAKIIGDKALDIYISTRKLQITGKFKSRPIRGKKENEPIIFVEDFIPLEDLGDVLPTKDELEQVVKFEGDEFFDILADSFAPEILGYRDIKKAILLHLVGGGNMKREEIHLFLIGNPSKAKSELLKAANEMVESSYINGKMASGAGIAYGMVKLPNGTMVAQVGPLGLYKFVQIDEFDKMKTEDRGALLEVLEQQSISLTKAGINSSIPAKPSVLGAANPKFSSWDWDVPLLKNINFESFFLTRFDLVIGIIKTDKLNEQLVVNHIIEDSLDKIKPQVEKELLKKYLSLCRTKKPKLSTEAGKKIGQFFLKITEDIKLNNTEWIPLETRQLQGMIRLATAHAKIMRKDIVDESDVDVVINLFKYSLDSFNIKYDGSVEQLDLFHDSKTREQIFFETIKSIFDKDGHFDYDVLIKKLAKNKKFGDAERATKYFDLNKGSNILLNSDGTYRLAKL